jgi:hypothetical protein
MAMKDAYATYQERLGAVRHEAKALHLRGDVR